MWTSSIYIQGAAEQICLYTVMVLGGWGFSRQIYTAASTMNKLSDSRGCVHKWWPSDLWIIYCHGKLPDMHRKVGKRGRTCEQSDCSESSTAKIVWQEQLCDKIMYEFITQIINFSKIYLLQYIVQPLDSRENDLHLNFGNMPSWLVNLECFSLLFTK